MGGYYPGVKIREAHPDFHRFPDQVPQIPREENMKKLVFIMLAVAVSMSCTTISKIISPSTSTPKPTETPALGQDLVGQWTMYYSWGCTSGYSSTIWTLYENGTFVSSETGSRGTWSAEGSTFRLEFNKERSAVYDGTISETRDHMEGTMQGRDAGSGCWYADKQ
jgi:hypothetical protein